MNDRKPLARAERLVASSVWLAPSTWKRVDEQGFVRGFTRGQFTRRLIEYALDVIEEQARVEATVGVLGAPRRTGTRF